MFQSHIRLAGAVVASGLLSLSLGSGCGKTRFEGYDDGGDIVSGLPDGSVTVTGDDGGTLIAVGEGGNLFGDGSMGMTLASSVYFMPPTINITVGNTPVVAKFQLMAKNTGYPDLAVAPTMAIFTRPDIAAMMPSNPVALTASGQVAGDGTLQGVYGGRVASAQLHVSVHKSTTGPGVDPAAPAVLDGATMPDPVVTSLLYPYDQTVFPQGLVSPLVMWTAPKAGDIYRLRFEEKDFVCEDYEVVTPPAQLRMAQDCWDALTASNQGDPVQVTLSRWDAPTKMAYVSAKETWPLARANMQGAVYYWSTSGPGDAYLARLRTGTGAAPEVLMVNGQQTCLACHAVSADGSTLVAVAGDVMIPSAAFPGENTRGGPATSFCATPGACEEDLPTDDRAWISFDLPNMTVRHQSNMFGGNVAVNPDGKYTVFGDVTLFLADTTTGTVYPNSGLDNAVLDLGTVGLMMPAFSPDGMHLAAVEGPADPSSLQPSYISLAGPSGRLIQLDFNEATRTFSNPQRLALESGFPATQSAIAYPTYTPDAKWLAFHVGDKPTACELNCDEYETSTGAIYLQSTRGAAPVRLATLTDTPTVPAAQLNHAFEPTFNPVQRGGYFWVVFSGERDWGNEVVVGNGTPPANQNKRLWVAAIDATPGAGDPSHPPFFLEGQDESRLNMRGFWALAACIPTQGGGACTAGFQCCSGYCDQGTCFMPGGNICVPIGGMCKTTSDCCNAPLVQCISGICNTLNQ
jgi:hypothetical protein